tara:strand:- start:182 stop:721 length:540 start_codon:yes stop_codon:yes gene_type:complete
MVNLDNRPRVTQRGFSLLELVVTLLIISILMAVAYAKLEQLAEKVERVSFEGSRNNIQAQVTLKVAYWFAEQQQRTTEQLVKGNPIDLIQHIPVNYAGELTYSELWAAPGEHWYFISDKQWLVYKVKRNIHLQNEFEQHDVLPFQLEVMFQNQHQDKGLVVSAKLQPLYKFDWEVDSDD